MSGGQTKSSALTTALAFHYQVLIGLDKCFQLQENQSIWFERDGDVSLIGVAVQQSVQIEVKDYSSSLTDNHENLWKTLKNWLSPDFHHAQYGCLVLHTTQAFGVNSSLKNWNSQSGAQRLLVLKGIFSDRLRKQASEACQPEISKIQELVMSAEESLLIAVLEKVTLFTEADNSSAIQEKLLAKPLGIPQSNLLAYLHGLIGFVYSKADSHCWQVTHKDFYAKCEELTSQLCKKSFTFPVFVGYEASENEIETHKNKPFVQKICDIEYHDVIPDAVGNWLELQNSLLEQLDENPLYRSETKKYQDKIVKKFKLDYSDAQISMVDPITSSKKLYNKVIGEHPLNMGNDIPPIEYKNGLLHDAMDDGKRNIKWSVK